MGDVELSKVLSYLDGTNASPTTLSECEALRLEWFGKEGIFRKVFSDLKSSSQEERVHKASRINDIKARSEAWLTLLFERLSKAEMDSQLSSVPVCDVSLPPIWSGLGRVHPITQIEEEIADVLSHFGFQLVEGPEIEDEYFCFDSLNIPKHHPARDMQDTYYTQGGRVLRTHTTSAQARELQKGGTTLKISCAGRVYRNETVDATHSDMFHQFEGFWLESGIIFPHLISLLTDVLKELYGRNRKVRFVPKYYPYTEPSVGLLINTSDGKWSTVGGAGMVHVNVLKEFNYDPAKISGLAFGLGTSRLVAERFGIPTMRALYDQDLRILKNLCYNSFN